MTDETTPAASENVDLFIVYAEAEGHARPLIVVDLTFARLMDDIVVPYSTGESFFVDGASVKAQDLRRIKILRAGSNLSRAIGGLHDGLFRGSADVRRTYGEQYHVRYEAILRSYAEDVTAQVIKAYDRAIKPRIRDYLPKRDELIGAAVKVFVEATKALGSG